MSLAPQLLALLAASASVGASPNFDRASVPGVYGEASNLYLIPDGVYAHPLYNDFNGDTDKLLTTSLKAGVLRGQWEVLADGEVRVAVFDGGWGGADVF